MPGSWKEGLSFGDINHQSESFTNPTDKSNKIPEDLLAEDQRVMKAGQQAVQGAEDNTEFTD